MTATTTFTAPAAGRTTTSTGELTSTGTLWKAGTVAGAAAAIAAGAYAAIAEAVGVSLSVGGKAIPVIGFAQVTFVAAIIGTIIAVSLSLRATQPRRTFLATTFVLTFVSFVPDALADAHAVTKLTLALSHVVVAAIVIPALASRLSD
jgi:hypothetical protein